ncbi:hypothetical protein Enr17x_18020 [Gimesia fumaroli]|uniref:Uncharacterized protein n=2 Tax=Gimesia fumaroli TaxID=2527976 RepID=A0A518I9J4_9PLAN|nr:hypothetical protein Enr17x_18020 [Gimesia fumaroli]
MQNLIVIILIIVAVVAMVLGGWVSFADLDESSTITIHKDEVKKDTESALEKGESLLDDATQQSRDLIGQTKDSKTDKPATDSLKEQ